MSKFKAFIKSVFGKGEPAEYDFEKAVGHHLLTLPRCSANIQIISPSGVEGGHKCKVIITAENLLPWAEAEAERVTIGGPNEEKAARLALPLLLRGADYLNPEITFLPKVMNNVIHESALGFVGKRGATMHCIECATDYKNINTHNEDHGSAGSWQRWTTIWMCPAGHEVYRKRYDMHLCFRRD